MMPKKTLFSFALALTSLTAVAGVLYGPASSPVLAETPTTYQKNVMLLPMAIPFTGIHEDATINIGGLPIGIDGCVYQNAGMIVIDGAYPKGIHFPSILTPSGPHGVGYFSLQIGPAQGCLNVGLASSALSIQPPMPYTTTLTLSAAAPTEAPLPPMSPDAPSLYSSYTGSLSTRIAMLAAVYTCVSA